MNIEGLLRLIVCDKKIDLRN